MPIRPRPSAPLFALAAVGCALAGLACGRSPDLQLTGMCDASAVVALDQNTLLVAGDEDNVIRAYDAARPGAPLWSVDVSNAIGVRAKPAKPGRAERPPPEADIEAAARVGDLAFWLTSHGRSSSGKQKPERLKLFATTVPMAGGGPLTVVGNAYEHLLDDLLAEPRLAGFGLREAAELAPKAPGGLNLEGLSPRREGGLWVGFRNPIPHGKAMLVPLLNPEQVVQGSRAKLGAPVLLELGGLGVRALALHRDRYLILAGAFDSGPASRLYTWDGSSAPRASASQPPVDLNPEAIFIPPGGDSVLLVSDDGSTLVHGTECKRQSDPTSRRFRARWLKP